jgi:hypothetical protein
MAGLPQFVFPPLDLGLGRTKKGVDFARETILLGALGTEGSMFSLGSVSNGVANTAVQAYFILPGRVKISKLAVFCSAIGTVAGTSSFNIVLGTTGAYTQGNIPGNDNSSVPPLAWNQSGQATSTSSIYPAGGGGICTNPATAGQAMFAADVAFNVTNFPNLTTATGTGTSYATILVPSNPDAVWPEGGVLTLRATTVTGTISNLIIAAYLEPQPLSPTYPSSQQPPGLIVVPGIDY